MDTDPERSGRSGTLPSPFPAGISGFEGPRTGVAGLGRGLQRRPTHQLRRQLLLLDSRHRARTLDLRFQVFVNSHLSVLDRTRTQSRRLEPTRSRWNTAHCTRTPGNVNEIIIFFYSLILPKLNYSKLIIVIKSANIKCQKNINEIIILF